MIEYCEICDEITEDLCGCETCMQMFGPCCASDVDDNYCMVCVEDVDDDCMVCVEGCPDCRGSGAVRGEPGADDAACEQCGGTGRL